MAGGDRIEWYPPGGFDDQPFVLHDAELLPSRVLQNVEGLEYPAVEYSSTPRSGRNGARLGAARMTRPRVVVPVMLFAQTPHQLSQLKRALGAALDPRRGTGRLLIGQALQTGEGEQRFLLARYRDGLPGAGVDMGQRWWRFSLVFECEDPFWYAPDPLVVEWRGKQGKPFLPFTFPFELSPYGVEQVGPLEYAGDTESWGVWTLQGPWSRVKVTNDATGQWWQALRGSGTGEDVVLRTAERQVRTASGANAYGLMDEDPGSAVFPIGPGESLTVEVDGAEVSTVVRLEVREAWLMRQ